MGTIKSLTGAVRTGIVLIIVALLFWGACSQQPKSFRLRVNYEPVGQILAYSLTSHRVGKEYRDDSLFRDFDRKTGASVIFTTQKILPNGNAVVLEEDRWHWDESVDTTGKVRRVSNEYAYNQEFAPTGKITSFKILGNSPPREEKYLLNYIEQANPVFPENDMMVGHQWTQTSTVTLPDGSIGNAAMNYRVKGTAFKDGHQCALVEYQGNMILPVFSDSTDTTGMEGVDRADINGMLYQAIDAGIMVGFEERRRLTADRTMIKEGRKLIVRVEFEDVISYSLDSVRTL